MNVLLATYIFQIDLLVDNIDKFGKSALTIGSYNCIKYPKIHEEFKLKKKKFMFLPPTWK